MKKRYRPFYILLIAMIALSGCAPAAPAQPYLSVETIAAATYAVIAAQTEAARPTATPIPPTPTATRPPGTATPTPTATFVLSTFTPTFTPPAPPVPTATTISSGSGTVVYSCDIVSASPENGYQAKPNEEFFWVWRVKNTGTSTWQEGEVKAAYYGGVDYSKKDEIVLDNTTPSGQVAEFRVKMITPKTLGRHTTTWSLRKGIHTFCNVQLQIYIVK